MIQDLTRGNPERVLWKFSLPLFASVIFQQLYNIADSLIAGKFAGEDALAAVGTSYPITMVFMAIAVGSVIGCSVVISTLFGGRRYDEMKTAISTMLLASLVLSVFLTAVGLLSSAWLMRLTNTPENIFSDGLLYLRVSLFGLLFLFFYNIANGVFTALGDSKTPLYFLIGSSLGNVVLDWLFVAEFGWGVAGVAWATFLAQGVACILSLIALVRRLRQIKTGPYRHFSFSALGQMARITIPSILQQSFVSVGMLLIQGLINGFGSSVIAGYSAAIKLNTFSIMSFNALSSAISSFTAQNLGAGEQTRVKAGFRGGLSLVFCIALPFFIGYFFFGGKLISLFLKAESPVALQTGIEFLKTVAPFYFIIPIKLVADGILRGAGAMREFMVSTFADLILRVVLAYVLASPFGVIGIWWSWPFSWVIGTLLSLYFYKRGHWLRNTI